MERVIYTTSSCDKLHWDMLMVFLRSLKINGNYNGKIIVDLINPSEHHITMLDAVGVLGNTIEIAKDNNDNRPYEHGVPPFNAKVMFTRLFGQMEVMKTGYDQILSIDTDIIFRGDIRHIWDDVEPGTLKVWERKNRKQWLTFQGGVIVYGNSPGLREFYSDYIRDITKDNRIESGQYYLYENWVKHSDKVKKIKLSKVFNDSKLKDYSVIWHVKHGHYKEPRWQKEFKKYL